MEPAVKNVIASLKLLPIFTPAARLLTKMRIGQALVLLEAGKHEKLARTFPMNVLHKDCEALLKVDRTSLAARRLQAWVYMATAQQRKAFDIFKEVVGIDPDSPEGQIGLALMAIEKSDPDKAIRLLQKLRKKRPEDSIVSWLVDPDIFQPEKRPGASDALRAPEPQTISFFPPGQALPGADLDQPPPF